jgi:hypothetical protein
MTLKQLRNTIRNIKYEFKFDFRGFDVQLHGVFGEQGGSNEALPGHLDAAELAGVTLLKKILQNEKIMLALLKML